MFFHCRHKIKYSCYQDSPVIRSWFAYLILGLRKALPRNSTKVKVEHGGFYSRVREKFLTSLTRFQELHPRWTGGAQLSEFVYLWSTDLLHHIRLQSCCSVFERGTKMEAAKAKLLNDARLQTAKDSPWHSSKPCSWVEVSATLRGVIQPSSGEHFKLWPSAFSPFYSAQEIIFWLMTSLNQRPQKPQNVNDTRFETSQDSPWHSPQLHDIYR